MLTSDALNSRVMASRRVKKKRVIFISVMRTWPLSLICFMNRWTTLPFVPSTLPPRTVTNRVRVPSRFAYTNSFSPIALVMP
ncbi:hypothetical protein D3C71_2142610 [compost metagenome]